jgi:hypothetical protein
LNYSKDSRKTDLTELWSDGLLETLVPNPSKLHFGSEVLHSDLQVLDYDLGDMHTLNPQVKEDIEFQIGLIINYYPRNFFPV